MKKIILLFTFLIPIFCFGQNESNIKRSNDTRTEIDKKSITDEMKKEVSKDDISFLPDTPSEFKGGISALMKFLTNEIKYPAEAREDGVQGKVTIKFTIEEDGSISNPTLITKINPLLDNEALRVISKMPKWIPAMNKGKACRSYFTVPIKFGL